MPVMRMSGVLSNQRGLTLAELLIAVFLIGVAFLGVVETFKYIQFSIQQSKGRTLATNIAQEKMQVIMQKPYYEVLVTTDPAYIVDGSTTIPYDPGYFAPETLQEGGVRFTRYTYVQVAQENSGTLELLPPYTPDTGMRQITVTAQWSSPYGNHYVSIKNIVNNPDTVMNNAILKGVVRDSITLQGIPSALVTVAENVGWRDNANATGNYLVNLSPGTLNFVANAQGYYSKIVPSVYVAPNATVTQDFYLIPISTGTISGTAWRNDHLVISQVMASSVSASGFDQEYVELFNPTTSYIPIVMGMNAAVVLLKYQTRGDASPTTISLDYTVMNSSVPPGGYFLIANTTTITAAGANRNADAVYKNTNAGYPDLLTLFSAPGNDAASVGISDQMTGQWIDQVGWTKGANDPPFYETTPIPQITGFQLEEQYVRKTSTSGVTIGLGRAYDSGTNSNDFVVSRPMAYPPRNRSNIETIVSGIPAAGAIASVNDGLSTPSSATLMGNPPYARFTVPQVTTGSWSLFLDSGTSSAQMDNVSIQGLTTTQVGPVILSTSGIVGLISGSATDINGNVIGSPGMTVSIGGTVYPVASNGRFSARLSTGTYDVIANPGLANPSYESKTQTNVSIALGDVTTTIDFRLAQGGRLQGWVTRDGTNALPGVSMVALDINGGERDTDVTDANGRFTLINLSTGVYTVQPVLDLKEASIPNFSTATVTTAGSTVWAGSFTVTGAMGMVSGRVTAGGNPIQSGALILVSTTTLSFPPPMLSTATLNSTVIYAGTSGEDGSYSLEVRGSTTTTYRVHALYMTLNNQTPSISSGAVSNITINAGQTTSNVNFSW